MNLKQQLVEFEGRVPHAYQDSLGKWTIGVGRLIDKQGGGLTDDEIDYLLNNDIREKTSEVLAALPWAANLNEPRQAVLIGMAFQLGLGGLLAFKNTLAATQAGRFSAAAAGMLSSKWAEQTPARVQKLAKQLQTGEWQT